MVIQSLIVFCHQNYVVVDDVIDQKKIECDVMSYCCCYYYYYYYYFYFQYVDNFVDIFDEFLDDQLGKNQSFDEIFYYYYYEQYDWVHLSVCYYRLYDISPSFFHISHDDLFKCCICIIFNTCWIFGVFGVSSINNIC